jgi:diguanylate cyclase (GGDEF)-like protein
VQSTPAHLADELKRDDGELWQLIELLTRGDAPQLLHDVLRGVASLVAADEVSLYAGYSPAMLIAAQGPRVIAEQHQIIDRRLAAAVTTRATITLDPDDPAQVWKIDADTSIRSGLWVPSPPGITAPAVVRVLRVRPEPFPAGTGRLVEIVARRLAGVLHQMQQQRDEQARDTERTQLFLVSASIAQELDFELVAERVAVGVTSVTDFGDATVEVRNGTTLRRVAAFGGGDLQAAVISPMVQWRSALVEEHRVGELTYRVPMHNGLPVGADDGTTTPTSGLVTQLQDREGDVLGFLTLSRPRTGAEPTEQMVQTIELFARQAQIALVNASLYVEAKRQRDIARTLMRVTAAVSESLETEQILQTCCEAALEHSVGERASIYLLEHGQVRFATSCGDDAQVPPSARGPLAIDEDHLLSKAAQSEPVIVDDLLADSRFRDTWLVRELGLRSVALYPLRTGAEVLGILVVDSHSTRIHFADHEAELLPQIAAQAAVALRQSRLHRTTREQATHNARLVELTTTMTTTFEFEDIFRGIVDAVRSRMDGHSVAVLRIRGRDMHVLGTITDDRLRCPSPPQQVTVSDRLREALRMVWKHGTLNIDDVRMYPALMELARPETRAVMLAAPLERSESSVLLTVSTTRPDAYSREHERFVADLVRITRLAVRNADLFVEVSDAAQRDPLTGLFNRRVFWEHLQGRLAQLDARTLALAVVDADDFKRVNDRLGHAVGDAALQHIAGRLRRSVRQADEVYRIGGEEFTVVMPDASEHDAHGVMSRTLVAVRKSRQDLPPLSVSVGVAVAPHDGRTADALFREADRTLLRAKHAGKNRIVLRSQVA